MPVPPSPEPPHSATAAFPPSPVHPLPPTLTRPASASAPTLTLPAPSQGPSPQVQLKVLVAHEVLQVDASQVARIALPPRHKGAAHVGAKHIGL